MYAHSLYAPANRFMPKEADGHVLADAEREGALWAKALENYVALTPGSNYHHPHNGTFRLTFTLRRPALLEGLARLEKTLKLVHWEGASNEHTDEAPIILASQSELTSTAKVAAAASEASTEVVQARRTSTTEPEMSYSEIVAASEILKSQPCAC
jgi:hypothetical protein